MSYWDNDLKTGLDKLRIEYTDVQIEQLSRFADLLQRWNKVYNLTSIRDEKDILTHHLLDSAALVPYVHEIRPNAKSVLDVGSGGGLPSIPLAILRPDLKVTAVDAVKKKTAFLTQVSIELGLHNFTAIHNRVENLSGVYEVISSRAFSSLELFTSLTKGLIAENGVWMAMKGEIPEEEITALKEGKVTQTIELCVPGLYEERHLIIMAPVKR